MKHEEILTALEEIDDKFIKEAEMPPKKRTYLKIAVAAVFILAILFVPKVIAPHMVVEASEPRISEYPDSDIYEDRGQWESAYEAWKAEMDSRSEISTQAMLGLDSFFAEGNNQFLLTEKNENRIWSPVNAYIGLAMMTELTEGETRQQILDVFGVEETDVLREQVSAVWESVYQDDSKEVCVLANSLWLEKGLQYNPKAVDALAYHYYASVYQGDLSSEKMNKEIASWIDSNTGNFLNNSTKNIQLSSDIIMALYSTLYFQATWSNEFLERNNTEDVFHTIDEEVQVVYMNKELEYMNYYWGENFGAVNMWLKNGCRMWIILPDEGMTTTDVLNDDAYIEMLLSDEWEACKYLKVNLSIPKFDVSSNTDLSTGFKNMGVTNVFNEDTAEFTKLTWDLPIYLTGANQSVRVEIDEEGVKAATYIEFPGAGAEGAPAEDEIIDFVVDRPFLFVINKENIPLFAGCVNNPEN